MGLVEIPEGVRSVHWRVDDPLGAGMEEVRTSATTSSAVYGLRLDELGAPVRAAT